MALFKLEVKDNNISNAELVEASKVKLDFEKHLEDWLEKSPWAITGEPIIWIGRQSTASVENTTIFPDLVGIDKDGNLVIVELKKGRAPRDVVAQLLEYAAWANDLSDEEVVELADQYFTKTHCNAGKIFNDVFLETFETDELPAFNQILRLFIAAGDIPPQIAAVCRFLRTAHGVDINCVLFSVYKTETGEMLVSSETVVGKEDVRLPKKQLTQRWSGEKPVKLVVWEAVQELTKGDKNYSFSPKDITQIILKEYPNFNKSTVGCQIISDCVGHTSRHHYPGGEDRYSWISKGQYRLYDKERDERSKTVRKTKGSGRKRR